MYRKNTSGQFVGFQMVLTATGAIATGLSPTVRRCIDGTFAAATGTVTEDTGTGGYKFAMSQADTNGNDVSFWFTATGAVPVCVNIVTTACDPTAATNFGITNIDAAITSRMATYSQPSGFLAATFPTGTVANTTNITAGTITTVTAVTGLTASNLDATISSRMATYTQPTGFLAATFPTTVASPTNITAGTITTVTNLTNAPTAGDFTATMKASAATAVWTDTTAGDFTTALSVGKSLMNGVSLGTGLTVNNITTKTGYSLASSQTFDNTGTWTGNIVGTLSTLTTYTGNTVQTGDAYARLGAPAGASHAADVAAVKVDTAAVKVQTDKMTFTVANKIDANVLNLNGDATSAANIAKTTKAIVRATASGVPTTTSIPTSACTPAGIVADQFKGRIITFDADTTTSALRGQATDITASSASSTPTFSCTALTTAPVSGDSFSIT